MSQGHKWSMMKPRPQLKTRVINIKAQVQQRSWVQTLIIHTHAMPLADDLRAIGLGGLELGQLCMQIVHFGDGGCSPLAGS